MHFTSTYDSSKPCLVNYDIWVIQNSLSVKSFFQSLLRWNTTINWSKSQISVFIDNAPKTYEESANQVKKLIIILLFPKIERFL